MCAQNRGQMKATNSKDARGVMYGRIAPGHVKSGMSNTGPLLSVELEF